MKRIYSNTWGDTRCIVGGYNVANGFFLFATLQHPALHLASPHVLLLLLLVNVLRSFICPGAAAYQHASYMPCREMVMEKLNRASAYESIKSHLDTFIKASKQPTASTPLCTLNNGRLQPEKDLKERFSLLGQLSSCSHLHFTFWLSLPVDSYSILL